MATPVRYIVITNGGECHAFVRTPTEFEELTALPAYNEGVSPTETPPGP
jgi:hypothetical protein